MIVRILGEGQWELDAQHLAALNDHDDALEQAVTAGDETGFTEHLDALLSAVRSQGTRLPDDALVDSDLILPPSDATLEEVRELLTEEGLVPD